jgi:RNA-binding protein Tab2/Atab2
VSVCRKACCHCQTMWTSCVLHAGWLRERTETVYQQLEGFNASIRSPPAGDPGPPKELPDTLRGEAWQFVQLPLADLQSELQQAMQVDDALGGCAHSFLHLLLPWFV